MNRLISTLKKAILLIIVTLCGFSCIRENTDNCPGQSVIVRFTYPLKTASSSYYGIDPTHVEDFSLYVFDSENKFYKLIADPTVKLDDTYYMEVKDLAPGTYYFVVWGNFMSENYVLNTDLAESATKATDLQLNLVRPADDSVRTDMTKLFYGRSQTTEIKNIGQHEVLVPIIENTNKINITVTGLDKNANKYGFVITDNNGSYGFDNSFAPCEEFHYTRSTNFGGSAELYTSLTVLRLAAHREPILKFYDQTRSELLYSGNLIQLINTAREKGADIDYDTTSEYDVVLKFETDMSVTVMINGWNVFKGRFEI